MYVWLIRETEYLGAWYHARTEYYYLVPETHRAEERYIH